MDVSPDKQNIDNVFSSTTYYIDFYQRQYKWDKEPVERLLYDIFYKFDTEYNRYRDNDIELDKLIEKYAWYYLNTYVTNRIEGKMYVVDGQQRLTTLTLILIKLRHLARHFHSELEAWISNKIAGQSGYKKEFWMNHEQDKETFKDLFDGKTPQKPNSVTAGNLINNYKIISDYLDQQLTDKEKLETFVFYFLKRLVLINLKVEQTDVPMVFEVINDRGVRLKPYEILKGKLLGQINKEELEALKINDLWDNQVNKINAFAEDEIDEFFTYFLRAKFADTVGDSRKFDKNYHRIIFNQEICSLGLYRNEKNVKTFIQNEFRYYTDLYSKILDYHETPTEKYSHVFFNKLTEMDSQFLLILSSCRFNDLEQEEKIKKIAYEVDRLFSLLQLQRSYDSNDFNEAIYAISRKIRDKGVGEIRPAFDEALLKIMSEARGATIKDVLNYNLFKDTGIELNKRFKRYFFARVEQFIADRTKMKMKHTFYDLVSNTGTVNGFHIEHILADNKNNLALFNNDPDLFERERNRLGGLLLLKGKDNISSNNESYSDKLKTYANTLYWNETLRSDTYKSKLDFTEMQKNYKLSFRPMPTFGPDELEERQKLLFDLIQIVWK